MIGRFTFTRLLGTLQCAFVLRRNNLPSSRNSDGGLRGQKVAKSSLCSMGVGFSMPVSGANALPRGYIGLRSILNIPKAR